MGGWIRVGRSGRSVCRIESHNKFPFPKWPRQKTWRISNSQYSPRCHPAMWACSLLATKLSKRISTWWHNKISRTPTWQLYNTFFSLPPPQGTWHGLYSTSHRAGRTPYATSCRRTRTQRRMAIRWASMLRDCPFWWVRSTLRSGTGIFFKRRWLIPVW